LQGCAIPEQVFETEESTMLVEFPLAESRRIERPRFFRWAF